MTEPTFDEARTAIYTQLSDSYRTFVGLSAPPGWLWQAAGDLVPVSRGLYLSVEPPKPEPVDPNAWPFAAMPLPSDWPTAWGDGGPLNPGIMPKAYGVSSGVATADVPLAKRLACFGFKAGGTRGLRYEAGGGHRLSDAWAQVQRWDAGHDPWPSLWPNHDVLRFFYLSGVLLSDKDSAQSFGAVKSPSKPDGYEVWASIEDYLKDQATRGEAGGR